jgi:hypothetical protein
MVAFFITKYAENRNVFYFLSHYFCVVIVDFSLLVILSEQFVIQCLLLGGEGVELLENLAFRELQISLLFSKFEQFLEAKTKISSIFKVILIDVPNCFESKKLRDLMQSIFPNKFKMSKCIFNIFDILDFNIFNFLALFDS